MVVITVCTKCKLDATSLVFRAWSLRGGKRSIAMGNNAKVRSNYNSKICMQIVLTAVYFMLKLVQPIMGLSYIICLVVQDRSELLIR